VHARFVLQARVCAAAFDIEDDFLVPADADLAGGQHIDLPTQALGVAAVHAEQIRSKQGGFITAGAGADFHDHIALVARVLGDEQALDFIFQRADLRLQLFNFSLCHHAQLFIFFTLQRPRFI